MVPLADGAFHLDDYVAYVQDFIRHIGLHATPETASAPGNGGSGQRAGLACM